MDVILKQMAALEILTVTA